MLRLPLEVAPLFRAWLDAHYPLRAAHVMSLVQQVREGRDYQSAFGKRMRGTGEFANLIERRFRVACRRLGLAGDDSRDVKTGASAPDVPRSRVRAHASLDVSRFRPPAADRAQLALF
jgi:DNA repair photolyase